MTHGYFVYSAARGPLRDLPLAWFAYISDARAWAHERASGESPYYIKQWDGQAVA